MTTKAPPGTPGGAFTSSYPLTGNHAYPLTPNVGQHPCAGGGDW
jgi:hypothetical protein